MSTPDEIRRAAAEWLWFPRDAAQVRNELQLVQYPARLGGGVRASVVDSTLSPTDVVDVAETQARAWGESVMTFWVGASDSPDIEDELRRRGAVHDDTLSVLARPVDGVVIDAPADVHAEIVRTREQVIGVDAVNVPVWRQDPLDEAGIDQELQEVRAEFDQGLGARVLATIDGHAVSVGGCTFVDGFVRLWGAATLEEARGRGGYRAVLAERLRLASERGVETALVKGRIATSAPILERAGFAHYGEERSYRLVLDG